MQMKEIEFLFGGSFDPVHNGHLHVIKQLKKFAIDQPVRILPCSVPALKKVTGASFLQRVVMLEHAIRELDENAENIVIDPREGSRQGKSYTFDTLVELGQQYPDRNFILVIGSDNLESLKYWHNWRQLFEHCHLLVVNRPGASIKDIDAIAVSLGFCEAKTHLKLETTPCGRYYCLNIEEKDISSTEIRNRVLKDLAVDQLISKSVEDYIRKEAIYK